MTIFDRIGHKIMAVISVVVSIGLVSVGIFYTIEQERTVLAQNERTMLTLTESVSMGLQTVMLAGYADIAHEFANRLKKVPEVADFQIARIDGTEAFQDNKTIIDVNQRRGEENFLLRERSSRTVLFPAGDTVLAEVLAKKKPIARYNTSADGKRTLTFVAPIVNSELCYKCHGKAEPLRGLIRLTTSLTAAERDILAGRQQALIVVGALLIFIVLFTGYMIGRAVIAPLKNVTDAMSRVTGGDFSHRVPLEGKDELSQMAESFNVMTGELERTYTDLHSEQDKLHTIISSAAEGMVVTDAGGAVVLVNPAATQLLDKTVDQIRSEGFVNVLDDPGTMASWLNESDHTPHLILYKERALNVYAATIRNGSGNVMGSAALLRDVTAERRLEEELRKLSTTDGLTGLYNRRFLDQTLESELSRAVRYQLPLSVLMCDIDHFKRFNDTHGHDMGDRVLKIVSGTFRGALRNNDFACRYGGEEFLAILPNTATAGGYNVAERFRQDVERLDIEGLKVTMSIGVATFPQIPVSTSAQLVEAADGALYEAKNSGRNRVRIAET